MSPKTQCPAPSDRTSAETGAGLPRKENAAMKAYKEMTPEERFEAVDRMATQLFGTKRWKTEFARTYGVTVQAVTKWMQNGAPVWAVVALSDAIRAQKWDNVREAVLATEGA